MSKVYNKTARPPLRLLVVNAVPTPIFRGGEKCMMISAVELKKRGHTIIVAGRKDSAWIDTCSENGLQTYSVKLRGDLDPSVWLFFYNLIKEQKIDGVLLSPERAVRLCGFPAKLAGVRAIVSRLGLRLPKEKDKIIYRFIYRRIVDRILTNSHILKAGLCRFSWLTDGRVKVVHNGVEIPELIDHNEKNRLRDELALPREARIIAAGGRLATQKGFGYLLDALAMVKIRNKDVFLILLGDGELRLTLEEQTDRLGLKDCVRFLGHRSDVPRILPAADIFILSSLYEGLPNIVMEAMAAGLPVIATAVGGVPELVEEGRTGILVKAENSKELSSAICKLLDDRDLLHSFGENGRRRVQDLFSIEQMVNGVEDLFYEILAEKL